VGGGGRYGRMNTLAYVCILAKVRSRGVYEHFIHRNQYYYSSFIF